MSPRSASVPPQIPGYQHLDLLGSGGFADVFLYEQRSMGGRKVAVKVLLQGLLGDLQQSFEAEARAMARLSNHPSIVSVFDAGQTPDGRAYLVMEHCPGAHLGTQVKSRPLNIAKALEVAIQVAGAVETAHGAGIIHRDIKPANILFTEFNRPALTDFGISASAGSSHGKAVGVSVPWAPPEQLSAGSDTDETGDVYSLAATLYSALTGHPPFWRSQGPNDNMSMSSRIMNDPVPPLGRDDAPASLQRVLDVAMNKRPDQRYPSALEFARALQQVQLELHLPVTSADVRSELAQVVVDDETEAGGTIAAGFVTIEASPTGPTDLQNRTGSGFTGHTARVNTADLEADGLVPHLIRHGRGSSDAMGPIEFTGPVPLSVVDEHTVMVGNDDGPAPSSVDDNPQRTEPRRMALWAAVFLVVVLVGAGSVWFFTRQDASAGTVPTATKTSSSKPIDPVGEVVPKVTGATAINDAGTVTVSWQNTSAQPGDTFRYRVIDPANPTVAWQRTAETKVVVKAMSGQTCLDVLVVRANGHSSDPERVCAA